LTPPVPRTFGLPHFEELHCSERSKHKSHECFVIFFFLCFLSSDAHEISVYLDLTSHQKHDTPSSPAEVLLNEA